MNTAKADVHAMLDSLPDDSSLEDIVAVIRGSRLLQPFLQRIGE